MKTGKTLVCGFLAVVLTLVFAACPEPGTKGDDDDDSMKGELAFELINNGTAYRVRGVEGVIIRGTFVIPASYNDLPVTEIGSIDDGFYESAFVAALITAVTIPNSVTSIGSWAFFRCTSLTSVTIGANVTTIGKRAFSECTSLASITIPDSVTSIGSGTFYSCTGLTSITLGISVTTIGDATWGIAEGARNVFYGCTSLTAITVNSGNPNYASEGGVLYDKDKTQILTVPLGITTVTIPNSVTNVYGSMFDGCTRLTAITVDSGNSNFASDGGVLYNKNKTELIRAPEGITAVTIPNGVTTIGSYAFARCTSLTSVTIPNSVTSIGSGYVGIFIDCTSLTSVTIEANVTTIGYDAFTSCTSLRSVTIGANVTLGHTSDYDSTYYATFPGDLDSVYTTTNNKAAGTYTSANGSSWTKQS
jgi:protein-L-isoaspartate O-methyltransferase